MEQLSNFRYKKNAEEHDVMKIIDVLNEGEKRNPKAYIIDHGTAKNKNKYYEYVSYRFYFEIKDKEYGQA